MQRVPDRGRGRGDDVRRRRAHDGPLGRQRRRQARRHRAGSCSGHGHTDHRGTAPGFGVPVLCHPDEVQDAEGSGGFRYWPAGPRRPARAATPDPPGDAPLRLGRRPGEDLRHACRRATRSPASRVIDLPGHAPGLIGLWRESDRLALVSDCFYTIDMWGRDCRAAAAARASTTSTPSRRARACASSPRWSPRRPGRGTRSPLTGDVREPAAERAADALSLSVAPSERAPARSRSGARGAEKLRRRQRLPRRARATC